MKKQYALQQIEIDWPVKALFNFVSDISNNAAWQAHVDETEWMEGIYRDAGARFRCKHAGREHPVVYEVTEFTPYRKRSVTCRGAFLQPTYSMEFEPRGEKTLLRVSVRFNVPWSFVAPWCANRYLMQYNLPRLKHILEDEN
jgi:hypothetical protein